MKLFGFLRKPDWEHNDAAVRLRAVQASTDPALQALLPTMAQADPDPAVRSAALRRVDDPNLLARRMRGDLDPAVAAVARERLVACLLDPAIALESRRAAMLDLPDQEVLARVAERAPESALRRAALEHLARPGLLFDRCLADPDPALRMWLLQRIDAPDALQRLADAARRRDKTLARAARVRLEQLLLESGDAATLQRAAATLAERAGRIGRELPADREQQLDALLREWAQLEPRVDASVQRRTRGALEMAAAAIAGSRASAPLPAAAADAGDTNAGDFAVAGSSADRGPRSAATAHPEPGRAAHDHAGPEHAIDSDANPDSADADAAAAASIALASDPAAGSNASAEGSVGSAAAHAAAGELLHGSSVHAEHAHAAVGAHGGTVAPSDLADADAARNSARQARRAQQHAAALQALQEFAAAVESSRIAEARSARNALVAAHLEPAERRRLSALDEQFGKLEQWQRWSGNEVRRRLCDEVEALHGSGLHPDALATRVKELQAEWSRLDALEGDAAPASESGLARRFRALCHRALRPARGYFEKRREVRGQRAEQVDALLADVASALEQPAAASLPALRRRVTGALRDLDTVAPEKRGEQGRALRECLARIDAGIAEGREEAALARRRLIARLRRDLGSAEAEAGIALAREAQAQWKRLERIDRGQEETLAKELAELIDPLFAGARERDALRRQQQEEAEAGARAVLEELEALAAADPARLAHADAHLESLNARWRALQPDDAASDARQRDAGPRGGMRGSERGAARGPGRGGQGAARDTRGRGDPRAARGARRGHPLEPQFAAALARVESARLAAAKQREREEVQAIASAGDLIAQLHADGSSAAAPTIAEVQQRLAALPLPGDARQVLQQLLEGGDAPQASSPDAEQLDALAVRAELVAGIDAPAADAALRRKEQMRRLAEKLEGSNQEPPKQEIRGLLLALQQRGMGSPRRGALQERILRAYDSARTQG